jgi:hypothetical protein
MFLELSQAMIAMAREKEAKGERSGSSQAGRRGNSVQVVDDVDAKSETRSSCCSGGNSA